MNLASTRVRVSRRQRGAPRLGRDAQLLQRAARRIGLQTAVLVWAAFALCAAVLLALVLEAQHQATADTLRSAVARADDVGDPPDGTWLAVQGPSGRIDLSPGAPAFMPLRPTPLPAAGAATSQDVHTPQGEYRVRTEVRRGRFVQAVGSLASEHAERTRLLEALAAAGLLAVLVAGAVGFLAARRWVSPLAEALTRQRAFVADASHELRTPLTRLNTRAQLVERSLRKGETDRATAESKRLIEDGRTLSTVLEDLLAAAEPVSESTWTLIDLTEVASTGAAAVAFEATQAEVEVVLEAAPPRAALVRGGRPALERTVVALLDNAIRHTPPAGTVTVSAGTEQRWATLSVADTGPGIPEAAQPRLFHRFAHGGGAHGPRRRFGLGLALVADTAERLGGEVDVQTGSVGTRFTVRLPRAEDPGGAAS